MTTETDTAPPTQKTPDALVGRLFEASLGMFDLMTVYLGDQLGLYRALRDGGAAAPSQLARRAGIDVRYAREWLEEQAGTRVLEGDDVRAAPGGRRGTAPESPADPPLRKERPHPISPPAP